MLAVPLFVAGTLVHPRSERLADIVASGQWQSVSHGLVALGFVLVLLGLPGLYAGHADRSGVLGLAAFVLMVLFVAFHVYRLPYKAIAVASLAGDPDAERLFAPTGPVQRGMLAWWGASAGIAGPILYGIALVRSGVYPRLAGWLVAAWTPLFLGFTAILAAQPPAVRDALLDLGIANVGILVSYLLLHLGLAIGGYQLWRTNPPAAEASPRLA
jgi:hypothetical protein